MRKSFSIFMSERVEKWHRIPVIYQVFRTGQFFFSDIAPAISRTARIRMTREQRMHAFLAGALSGLIFCLIIPCIWTIINGRFAGGDSDYIYFSNDIHNLITYIIICPLYLGLGSVLIATVIDNGANLRELQKRVGILQPEGVVQIWKTALFFTCTIAFSLTLTVNYISDATNLEKTGVVYWFANKIGENSVALNALGVYYFILNFLLLTFTVWSFMAFMTAFTAVAGVASALEKHSSTELAQLTRSEIEIKLEAFGYAYLFAKCQVAVYIINFWIWEKSPLGNTGNIKIAHLFLVIIGWLCLSIPRHYLELQWARYCARNSLHEHSIDLDSSLSLPAQMTLKIVDWLLIGSILAIPYVSGFLSY